MKIGKSPLIPVVNTDRICQNATNARTASLSDRPPKSKQLLLPGTASKIGCHTDPNKAGKKEKSSELAFAAL
jgi:hypothetical protein